ncbi:penicillin-binding protein 2 [Patescibacteria group bacterium]|nr:penicillin-binding protein 2 [Patescibacteria group bacterium]
MSELNNNDYPEKRITSLFFILVVVAIVVFIRLFQISVLENKNYLAQAESQHKIIEEVPAHRGKIFTSSYNSSDTYELATNLTLYALTAVPKQIQDKERAAEEIAKLLFLDKNAILEKIKGTDAYIPPLAHKLSLEQADAIEKLDLKGIYISPEEWRYYPEGDLAAHIIGYVDTEGKGNYGVEGYYNQELSGDSGAFFAEKDVKGRYIQISAKSDPQDGTDLVLSLDRSVEHYAEDLIKESVKKYGAKGGQIIVMDPSTFEIIAMASDKSFDPNNYAQEAQEKTVDIFANPNTAKAYEPGSVLKVMTMAGGLDSGSVTAATEETFPAFIEIQGHKIWTWDKKAHGKENMTQVLETSNNVGIIFVQQRMGKSTFYDYFRDRFGFGEKTGIDLDSESAGKLVSLKQMQDVEAANIAFGQGIAATPLQVVASFAAIGNQGKMFEPHIVKEIIEHKGDKKEIKDIKPKFVRQVVSPETAEIIKTMMEDVVLYGYGKEAQVPGYRIAGKSGTAQIPGPGGYLEDKTIHSFVGLAPAEDPKFVILVKLDEPATSPWASYTATSVFSEMASYLFKYYQIPPNK